jgi:hypothetical protein
MTAIPVVSDRQRQARLAARHRLAPACRADNALAVTRSLVALHGTDPGTVYLSAAARLCEPGMASLEQALYVDRSLLRMHGMRRTVFVVPTELVPVVQYSSNTVIAKRQRATFVAFAATGGFDTDWLAAVERDTLAALEKRGTATANELSKDVPGLAEQIEVSVGKNYAGKQGIGSRLLTVLGMEGRIVRGRPRGSWLSGQYEWSPATPPEPLSEGNAQAELVRAYLRSFGPATEADVKWWTGWTVTAVRKAFAAIGAQPVTVDNRAEPGFLLPDDVEPVEPSQPWAALLPGLDPTPMGWQQRDWYLPAEHTTALFDRSGNIGPTVWWDGRIIGGWAQRADGEIRWRLLADRASVGADALAAVETEAARLAEWLGAARVTPRFRTPLERELADM